MQERSTAERGWRLAGLLLLGVIAFFWMPLGVRDASGVSSVIPALRPASSSRPDRPTRPAASRPNTARAVVTAGSRSLAATPAALAGLTLAVAGVVVAARACAPRPPRLGSLRSRGPPAVL